MPLTQIFRHPAPKNGNFYQPIRQRKIRSVCVRANLCESRKGFGNFQKSKVVQGFSKVVSPSESEASLPSIRYRFAISSAFMSASFPVFGVMMYSVLSDMP